MVEDARSGHGRADDPLDARVERAFSDAVDRQLAEQRALNQLVETAADRLGAIEAALRSLRETTSTQGVALRAEFQEGVARLAEDFQERFGKLASELDRLRQSSTDHAVRLVQIVQATDDSLQSLEDRQARLSEQLAELEDREPDVDLSPFAGPSPTIAPEELAAALEPVLEGEITGLQTQLSARIDAVEDGIANLRRLQPTGEALAEDVRRMVPTSAALAGELGDHLTALRDRLVALDEHGRDRAAEQRQALADVVDHLQRATTAFAEEVDELDGIATAVSRRAAQDDERLAGLRDDLVARIDERMQDTTATMAATTADSADELRAQVTASNEEIRELLDAALDDRLGRVEERLAELTDGVTERLRDLGDEVAQRLGAAESRLGALADDLEARIHLSEERAAATRAAAEERLNRVQEQLAAVHGGIRADLDAIRDVADGVRDTVHGRLQRSDEHLEAMQADVQDRLALTEGRLETYQDELRDRIEEAREGLDTAADGVTERLSAWEARVDDSRNRLAAEWRAEADAARARLEEVLANVFDQAADATALVEQRLPELVAQRLDEVAGEARQTFAQAGERLTRTEGELRGVAGELSGFGSELDARVGRAVERAVTVARSEAHDAAVEVEAATARIETVLRRVADLESNLVAYLDARDRHLEEQRSRIFIELLDEFADVLPRRQRGRVATALESARERVVERFSTDDGAAADEVPHAAASDATPDAAAGTVVEEVPEARGSERRGGLLAELLGDEEVDATTPPEEPTRPDQAQRPADSVSGADADDGHVCPECGFVAKTGGGLASHRRTHG